ncbi:hypothetical protein AN414_24350 [Serratia marcescens]|uniref:NAD(P)-dependent alcohol dehydrogenase n=1 Tax=Serratia TaxID=613 RepID=UPI000744DF21|nr:MULTISPECIES: NAD(P)-dependent alcohol dehydrogenase [Serratia]KXJ00666.1 hypothetical protein AN414_24350 [Serratia marcescens]MBX9280492.1 NAD(P)-dependent alcohol dehydrogenase [Serratia marcescens]MBX9285466.1 NAD(P)-dependent alcohol dehydrogenase [Serratia marcescens]MBX9290505.1 NAD(P)-dependent alcohol dehydrogenase [Serratia marcescens]MBX9299973.1 NAD(P)-dependent alcohol dehydrogenase [Serratia marcescens]
MKIKAIVTSKETPFSLQDVNLREPDIDEVLVRIIASGVCHTDAVVLRGNAPLPLPAVLGHEGAGIVERVGSAVTEVVPGDHVVIGFSYCGYCDNCRSGKNGACEDFVPLNSSGVNGHHRTPLSTMDNTPLSLFFGQSSFAAYSTTSAKNVVKVDRDVDLRLLGPLGCGFMTGSGTILNALKPEPGSSIAIFGTGAVGLAGIMAAQIAGCSKIIAIDIHSQRLELAQTLGATHVVNSMNEDAVARIVDICGKGADFSMDTTGISAVQIQAIRCLRVYGTMAAVAVSNNEISLNLATDIVDRGLTIKGVLEGDAMPQIFIPRLLQFWREGKFPIEKLIRFYKPEQVEQAFADSNSGDVIKPVLVFDHSYMPV